MNGQRQTNDNRKAFSNQAKYEWYHFLLGKESAESTPCGKTSRLINATKRLDDVTCPRCLTTLKEENWFCPKHGFIHNANVTFEETCGICGLSVIEEEKER